MSKRVHNKKGQCRNRSGNPRKIRNWGSNSPKLQARREHGAAKRIFLFDRFFERYKKGKI